MNLLLQAEIFSITGLGKLRVTYNWQNSALNCSRIDKSPFIWNIYQTQNNTIAMSPQVGFAGKTLYASVRDDGDWYLQVQAPHSLDWITAAQRDEFIGLELLDLGLAKLTGFNNQLIGMANQPDWIVRTENGVTAGDMVYRLRSIYTSAVKESLWFFKIIGGGSSISTSGIRVANRFEARIPTLESDLEGALQQHGINVSSQELSTLIQQINA
jgi:hypothetical protein